MLMLLLPAPLLAQNPISSKVMGSKVAADNRKFTKLFGEGAKQAGRSDPSVLSVVRDSAVSQLAQVNKARFNLTGSQLTARQWLDSLRKLPDWEALVEEALALESALVVQGLPIDNPRITELAAGRALSRVLKAQQNGHTNQQRWYVGGQVGLPLFGGDGLGSTMRASARAAYFVPISPFRRWQLPIVTNIGELTSSTDDSERKKADKIISSSDGAYLSMEPTWDPIRNRLGDLRLQPFLAIGGQLNQMSAKSDTSRKVTLGQARLGAGANLELGRRIGGQSIIFVSSRFVYSMYNASAYEEVFGDRRGSRAIVETYGLLPIGASTSLLIEATAARGAKPVFRVGLWSQASSQQAEPPKEAKP